LSSRKPPSKRASGARRWAGYAAYGALALALLVSGGVSLGQGAYAALRLGLGVIFGLGLLWLLLASELGRWLRGIVAVPDQAPRADWLLLLWLGLLPLFWFPAPPAIITGSDLWFPLAPADFLARSLFTWDERVFAGYGNFLRLPHLVPYYLAIGGLDRLGLPLPVVERVWFVALFTAPGLAMYACARAIGRHGRAGNVPVFAALVYMLSPVVVKDWAAGHQLFALAGAGWAGMVALLVRLNAGALAPFGFAWRAGLLSLAMTPVMSNPALALVYAASLGGLALALAVRRPGSQQSRRG
jgi:hypothetical protein